MIIEEVKDYVQKKYDPDEYNWYHIQYVTKIALELGKKLNADIEILEIAAFLHDIDYFRGKEFHAQDSAKFAEQFLTERCYPNEKIEKVKNTILCHNSEGMKIVGEPSMEGKILNDADKMWTMTPVGFARMIAHRYRSNTSYASIFEKLNKAINKFDQLFFDVSREMVKLDRDICITFLNRIKESLTR